MTSSFTWLDHTDGERRKVLEAIDRLRERETRDELGFGSIRNVFADQFFPGTTLMQTRPRYFLVVPWLYQMLARKRSARADIANAMRREELRMIETLKAAGETDGVIGKRSGKRLVRTPSSIFWLGLRDWGICRFPGIQDDFHRHFERLVSGDAGERDDDGVLVEAARGMAWDPHLPPPPEGFPDDFDLNLRRNEAIYLRERIIHSCKDSVLSTFVRKAKPAEVRYVWEHPAVVELPASLAEAVEHARILALVAHGAVMLYGLMLNEKLASNPERDERIETLRQHLRTWSGEARSDLGLARWDRAAFWSTVTKRGPLSERTRRFVDRWLELAVWTRTDGGAGETAARHAVEERERQLKGARSRLHNRRALELWNPADSFARIDYRWPTAQRHLEEIHHAGAA